MERVIISPEGKIIDSDAPHPSVDELRRRALEPIATEYRIPVEELMENRNHPVFKDILEEYIKVVERAEHARRELGMRPQLSTKKDAKELENRVKYLFQTET